MKLKPTPANLKYASRLKGEIENAIAKGTFDYAEYFPASRNALRLSGLPGAAISVKNALRAWLDGAKPEIERSTYLDYRNSIENHLIPQFGKIALSELKRRDVKEWVADLEASPKRINNLLIPLRQMLKAAVNDEEIKNNPLEGYEVRRKKAPREEIIDPFSLDEIRAILEASTGQIANLFQFAFWTGLRTSELIALEWGDVDWRKKELRVSRAKVRKEIKVPKTESGYRAVRLLNPALEALKAQKTHTFLAGAEVFYNPRTDAPWAGDGAIRKTAWQPLLKKAKVRYRYPYQTRHTYASMMLSAGENPLWVAHQMGHKDWSMINRVYGKWIPANAPEAGNKAVELWSTSGQRISASS